MNEIDLQRSVERWAACSPKAISEGSQAQVFYALQDAQKDIAALSQAVASRDAELYRLRNECRDGLDALSDIDDFWDASPYPDNRKHLSPAEQVSSLDCELNAAHDKIARLETIEAACKRLAYIVRKSVNSGPLSRDPTQEAEAWRQLRMALGEGYDERGNLVPIGEAK